MPFGPSRRDVKNRSWRFFCTAACNLPADPAGSPCIPTWGREQSPLAVRCQRAFYLAVPRHRGTGRAARWKAPRGCVASAPGSCAAPESSPAALQWPLQHGVVGIPLPACVHAGRRADCADHPGEGGALTAVALRRAVAMPQAIATSCPGVGSVVDRRRAGIPHGPDMSLDMHRASAQPGRADAGWAKARRGQSFRHRASQPWRPCVAVQTAERRRREGVVKSLRSEPVNGWVMSRIDTNRHKNPEGECGRFCKCCIKLSLADGSGFVVFPARSASG